MKRIGNWMTDLSRHELLALREIRLTGQTSQTVLVRQLLDEEIIVDAEGNFALAVGPHRLLIRACRFFQTPFQHFSDLSRRFAAYFVGQKYLRFKRC
jgi:hypothetical protein